MSSQPNQALTQSVNPTEAECNLILALRRANSMGVVDPDSMTFWPCGKPQYLNGKRREGDPAALPYPMEFHT